MTHSNSNNQENTSQHVNQNNSSQPNSNGVDANGAAATVFNSSELTAQQVEGLTDTSDLQDASNVEDIPKNPENALQEEGSERERAAQLNDGSAGNQTIRNAVENLNTDELIHNLEDGNTDKDKPSPNPAPFISPD